MGGLEEFDGEAVGDGAVPGQLHRLVVARLVGGGGFFSAEAGEGGHLGEEHYPGRPEPGMRERRVVEDGVGHRG
jgi:hypothetical protein